MSRSLFFVCLTLFLLAKSGDPQLIAEPLLKNEKINYANFKKILPGMTVKEVETTLGGPPGVYTRSSTFILTPPMPSSGCRLKQSVAAMKTLFTRFPVKGQKIWYGDEAVITIYFGFDSKVLGENGKFYDQAFAEN
jgi:hypothetical protein